ncbi:MAG: cytochrome c oxidase assembly protein [Gammaproteobacteria bacterium]|nr:cytochrome c oxidase assembly protein [Gammaproteobacteria bacterium]
MIMRSLLDSLLPSDFSPAVLTCTLLALGLYLRGLRRLQAVGHGVGVGGVLAYLLGVLSLYAMLQTRIDYYAQHMFYIHRLQHLVLHHLGPFLIALSAPQPVLRAGVPNAMWRRGLAPVLHSAWVRRPLQLMLSPILAPVLFVAGIGFWLIPPVHFAAMLSLPIYNTMNWSMIVDGLPFWWLMLDPRPRPPARLGYGARIAVLMAVMLPQILIGAVIGLSRHDLFNVYGICGRLYPISAVTDQQIGGLIIWIPGSMMSVIAALLVLGRLRGQQSAGFA